MNSWQRVWIGGLDRAHRRLDDASAAPVLDRLRTASFPGALVVLSGAGARGRTGAEFLREVAQPLARERVVRDAGLDADAIERILTGLFVDRKSVAAVARDEGVVARVLERALVSRGVPVTPGEADEIVHLLQTGEFFGDIAATTSAVFRTVPRLAEAVLTDLPDLPRQPRSLIERFAIDFHDLVSVRIRQVAIDARDGRIDSPPPVLRRTLSHLYGIATIGTTRDLLRQLLHRSNRSVRLALVLYARANGFPIEEADIDSVLESMLDPDAPDLGPVLAEAVTVLRERYGARELGAVLEALQPADAGT
jgi:hypothetical protein